MDELKNELSVERQIRLELEKHRRIMMERADESQYSTNSILSMDDDHFPSADEDMTEHMLPKDNAINATEFSLANRARAEEQARAELQSDFTSSGIGSPGSLRRKKKAHKDEDIESFMLC